MNTKCQWLIILSLMAFVSGNVNAQIYKWTDKDGVVRYTDTPPPNSVKNVKIISNKKATEPQAKPQAVTAPDQNAAPTPAAISKEDMMHDAEAKKRHDLAEIEKQKKAQKEAEAKQNAANCTSAKANYQTYSQGGRVYEVNEKGERVYLDSSGLAEKAAKAQQEMQQYCK